LRKDADFVTLDNRNRNLRAAHVTLLHCAVAALAAFVLAIPAGQASEERAPGYKLLVRPSICVSYNSDEPCTMSMQVSWEGDAAADVCLRDAMLTPMLQCWQDSTRGSATIPYANTVDVRYQLVEESSLGVLAEADVKVINRDLRDSRKRRRHVWSIL
jgi:hypothetical protein